MAGTDQEIFAEAMSEAPATPEPSTTTVTPAAIASEAPPAAGSQPRDPMGRFAGKPADGAPEGIAADPAQSGQSEAERAKTNALREARDELAQYKERLARLEGQMSARPQPQPQPVPEAPAPVLWDDPDAFTDYRVKQHLTPLERRLNAMQEMFSEANAAQEFGKEAVPAAKAWLESVKQQAPAAAAAMARQLMQTDHPYRELVLQHRRATVLQEIGDDPAAYKAKLLKDPEFRKAVIEAARAEAAAGNGQSPSTLIDLPPSLNGATGRGNASAPPADDKALFSQVMAR